MSGENAIKPLELKLRLQHAQLRAALDFDSGDGKVVESDQTGMGQLSRLNATAPAEMPQAARARMHTELRRVDAAIGRLESGRYGVCCRCQERVDLNRLQSDPATPFCLPCIEEMAEDREANLL